MSGLSLQFDYAGEQDFALQLDCELPAQRITAIYGPVAVARARCWIVSPACGGRNPAASIHSGTSPGNRAQLFTPPWQRRIGYVFQDARLFPHLSVKGNLDYALHRRTAKEQR